MLQHHRRRALTLIEILISLGIISILLALLLPAIQYARERMRRSVCQNQLRQMVLATHAHESAHGLVPSLYNGTFREKPLTHLDEYQFHSWQTAILPGLELSGLHERAELALLSTDTANSEFRNSTVPVFLCPSSPDTLPIQSPIASVEQGITDTQQLGTAARGDYEAVGGLAGQFDSSDELGEFAYLNACMPGVWGEPRYDGAGNVTHLRKARFRDVTDGLSYTLLITEQAGRPDYILRGQPIQHFRPGDPVYRSHVAGWAVGKGFHWLLLDSEHGVNDTNAWGVFSFHAAGANVALADGSVRLIAESTDRTILHALATRPQSSVA